MEFFHNIINSFVTVYVYPYFLTQKYIFYLSTETKLFCTQISFGGKILEDEIGFCNFSLEFEGS